LAKKFKFELNRAGVRELMQSGAMQSVLISRAGEVASAAGDGYDVYVGRTRANVSVRTATEAAAADNLEHNTLEKVIRR
jgi:hypothetical protein